VARRKRSSQYWKSRRFRAITSTNKRTRENVAKTHFPRLCRASSRATSHGKPPCPSAILRMSAKCLRALPRKHYLAPVRGQTRHWGRNDGLTLPLSNKVELHFCREKRVSHSLVISNLALGICQADSCLQSSLRSTWKVSTRVPDNTAVRNKCTWK
jgi:hypothetical protein